MVSTSRLYPPVSYTQDQTIPHERAVCHLGKADTSPRLTSSFMATDAHRALEGQPDFVFSGNDDKFMLMDALCFLSDETTGGWATGISTYDDTGTFRWLSCERETDRRALIGEIPALVAHVPDGPRGTLRDFAWGNIRGTISEYDLAAVLRAPDGTVSIRSNAMPADYKAYLDGGPSDYQRKHPLLLPLGRF